MSRAVRPEEALTWAWRSLPPAYARALESLIDDAERDDAVEGLLLTGSMARLDAAPGTDIDVRVVLRAGETSTPPFQRFERSERFGVPVELARATADEARGILRAAPINVYAHLDGVALYDPAGTLAGLRQTAAQVMADYRVPAGRKRQLADELGHPQSKARAALAAADLLKATYSLATASWQLIEGLWAANDLPCPPNASVRPHLRDLRGPADVEATFAAMFLAEPRVRVEAGLSLLSWVRAELTGPGPAA